MSNTHDIPVPHPEKLDSKQFSSLKSLFLFAGGAGLLISLIGLFVPSLREQFAFSWLFGFSYFFTICLGCIFWTCLHHATDSDWSVVVRRQFENLSSLVPYFALFFIPILICAGILFKWWNLSPGDDPLLDGKSGFLNKPFFIIRAVLYFAVLSAFAFYLKKHSTLQDSDGNVSRSFSMRRLGVGGIPAVALGITFSGIDWLMGLNYHWFSTMWGVYLFAGAAGSSMSLLVLLITALKSRGYLKVVNAEHYHTMGKFMFAFSVFWAYIGFSQYMLIWYANIPEETTYYITRNTGGWWYLSVLLVVGRFLLPFAVLLLQWSKKAPKFLSVVAIWILVMQLVDIYVVVLPALHGEGLSPSIFDFTSLVGIGGILGWILIRKVESSNLFPTKDPRLAASLKLTN